jgi:hypothetical protein
MEWGPSTVWSGASLGTLTNYGMQKNRKLSISVAALLLRSMVLSVSFECCLLAGRGLCVGLISRPEESYQVLCVLV